MWMAKLKL